MPNHCGSTLHILLPTTAVDSFVESVKGPTDWPYPEDVLGRFFNQRELSAHEILRLEGGATEFIAAFRERYGEGHGRVMGFPDWMPVSRADIERFVAGETPSWAQEDTFSIARLLPMTKEEFESAFPGKMEGPYWVFDEGRERSYRSSLRYGLIAFRMNKIGTKWSLYDVAFKPDEDIVHLANDQSLITIRYTTAWGPVSSIDEALSPILKPCGGRYLLLWDEEGGNAGMFYGDPANEIAFDEGFGDEVSERVLEDDEEEDDEETGYYQISRQKMFEVALEKMNDTDFANALLTLPLYE